MSVFVHAQGIKTVHARGLGQKMAKLGPRSCRMTPKGGGGGGRAPNAG